MLNLRVPTILSLPLRRLGNTFEQYGPAFEYKEPGQMIKPSIEQYTLPWPCSAISVSIFLKLIK